MRAPQSADFVAALKDANSEGLLSHGKTDAARRELTGLSGNKLTGALQRLTSLFRNDARACYLEVGVFQGLTLNFVASANPTVSCYGIDNFAFFDPRNENLGIVRKRIAALGNDNAHLINADYEDAFGSLRSHIGDAKIAVYFVDGPHDYRSQLMCLQLALPHLHDHAVIVVDDANYEHVRQANADFLAIHTDWRLIAQAYTPAHPKNLSAAERSVAENGWWNGVNVLCRDATASYGLQTPPTRRSRSRFENDHLVHAHRMEPFVLESLRLTGALARGKPLKFARELRKVIGGIKRKRHELARFEMMNTWSESLPSFEVAQRADERGATMG